MKKFKKIAALVLAGAMVLGMSTTAFAENVAKIPAASDKATVQVQNVEKGAKVFAYQIVEGKYDVVENVNRGFVDYVKVDEDTDNELVINNVYAPTADEVTAIARQIGANEVALTKTELSPTDADAEKTTYTANLEAGYWVVLVRGTVDVYNPMLVGVYYDLDTTTDGIQGSGTNNVLVPGVVNADGHWTVNGTNVYAKSVTPDIVKKADVDTQKAGGTVNYTVTTTVPDYSEEYTKVDFTIDDALTNLTLDKDTVKVYVNGSEKALEASDDTFTLTTADKSYKIEFDSAWILKNTKASIVVEYSATVDSTAINDISADNTVTLTYSNDPGTGKGHDTDVEKVYSFDIDAGITKKVVTKVNETKAALENATFTLYTDEACKNVYTNDSTADKLVNGQVISDKEGQLHISGLAAGTYYLKETAAPDGYTINETIYKIEIKDLVFSDTDKDELESWNIVVTDMTTKQSMTNGFTIDGGSVKVNDDNVVDETQIANIKLVNLPSTGGIGTTIFTVGGVAIILAAAAMLFARRRVAR